MIRSNLDSFYVSDDLRLECNVLSGSGGGGGDDQGLITIRWEKDGGDVGAEPNVHVIENVLR